MVLQPPPGWPPAVRPPGSEGFTASAVAWLLDVLPEGYREHTRVHRYPVGLAVIARHHSQACVSGARQGYRTIRAELGGRVPAQEADAVLAAYAAEGAKLAATARAGHPLLELTSCPGTAAYRRAAAAACYRPHATLPLLHTSRP